jgi:3-mercaptopyruvate sulfurtransferase SseA
MSDWNDKVKRLLKSELVRRGISNSDLANMLEQIGIEETKSSIDSKISRGTFSASFFLQCLTVIGCEKLEIEEYENQLSTAAEPQGDYNLKKQ